MHSVLAVPTDDDRVERAPALGVSADHELPRPIESHLAPRPGARAWLVHAIEALGHEAFESLGADGRDQIGEGGVEPWCRPDWIGESGQDLPREQVPPVRELLTLCSCAFGEPPVLRERPIFPPSLQ
jgi:hypothetical protein